MPLSNTYPEILDALAFSMWIKCFAEKKQSDEPVKSLVSGIIMDNLKGKWKEAFEHIIRTQKNTTVVAYIDDHKNGLQVAVTVNEKLKQIVLTFRGSNATADCANSSQSQLKDKIFVHAGFLKLIKSHFTALNAIIDELVFEHRGFTIILTGHGSGGALSTLYGYFVAERVAPKYLKVRVVSFASPRVGNLQFRQACDRTANLNITRVSYRRDSITAMPMFNYYHVGSTTVHLNTDAPPQVFLNYTYGVWQYSRLRCWSENDHCASRYWAALKRNGSEEPTVSSAQCKPKIAATSDAMCEVGGEAKVGSF